MVEHNPWKSFKSRASVGFERGIMLARVPASFWITSVLESHAGINNPPCTPIHSSAFHVFNMEHRRLTFHPLTVLLLSIIGRGPTRIIGISDGVKTGFRAVIAS